MFVHSSLIRKHFEYLQSRSIATTDLYTELACNQDDLLDPDRNFGLEEYLTVLTYALERTSDPFYGLNMGREPHIAGTIGMLCASCRNLREAFTQGCKYFSMQGNISEIEFLDRGRHPGIRYTPAQTICLNDPELSRQDTDIMFSFLNTILKVNSGGSLLPYEVRYSCPEPEKTQEYVVVFGSKPVFDSEHSEILFREADLGIPMKAFNPDTFELLRVHVERQMRKTDTSALISERVRSILLSSHYYSFPDMMTVASKLKVSARTLQRMLSGEKTSFKALLQDTRRELAIQLLGQKDLTISEIAYTLGYSDVGNFSRSFKKAQGLSPQEFRCRKTEPS